MTKISLVVSVYNEEEVLVEFHAELLKVFQAHNIAYELIFVNDGSYDNSFDIIELLCKTDSNTKGIHFSRNFGHEAAMLAGINKSTGDALICMDCDLQHPPALIPKMLEKYAEGYYIVNMIGVNREDANFWKTITTKLFYRFLNKIIPYKFEMNASDFFLISKKIVKILNEKYNVQNRFLRGFIQTLGFKRTAIKFEVPKRKAGKSKYSLLKLLFFSFDAIVSFSKVPLRLGVVLGVIVGLFGLLVGVFSIVMYFLNSPVSGYTTLVVLNSIMFSFLFFLLGILGEYMGHIFDELKSRPIYIIEKESNISK